jgi:4-hydroxythreonine-4-phosphate dehydrogenase
MNNAKQRMRRNKIRVGITIGDPSGIGPVITLKAIQKLKGLAEFTIIGDEWVLRRLSAIRIMDLRNVPRKNFSFGKVSSDYGRASLAYIDKALELISNGEIDCLVTCPVSKEAVSRAGFKFSGHTEYLAEATNTKYFAMMLLNKYLRVSLLTRHLPLKDVPADISIKKIYDTVSLTFQYLAKFFNIKKPNLVICGLNPHASDNGLIGNEEKIVMQPALKKLKSRAGIEVAGPLPSDVAFSRAMKKEFDCVIAAYHDQALIPLKLSGENTGVNLTLGLPFVRTSPLHGTAFDIAKYPKKCDPSSLIEAIKLAVECALNLKKD